MRQPGVVTREGHMPDWRNELDSLLTQLDDPAEGERPVPGGSAIGRADGLARHEPGDLSVEDSGAAWEFAALQPEDAPRDGDEVTAVRREIEATIRRLASLARAGEVDASLRDDVIFVLQALTRPHPPAWAPSDADPADDEHMEWHLASAAAILRFCRIVQRLTNVISDDLD